MLKSADFYVTDDQKMPFFEWYKKLNIRSQAKIDALVDKAKLGIGSIKSVGGAIMEIRDLSKGPGYRVYFGNDGPRLILLLIGGDKSSQKYDIRAAHSYWSDYQDRKKAEAKK